MCMPIIHIITTETSSCSDYDVRLVNGSDSNEGRVEVCLQGDWGAVYESSWDRRDARVVCRQLGYQPGCETIQPAMELFYLLALNILFYFLVLL